MSSKVLMSKRRSALGPQAGNDGFTLLELLLATAIFAVVVVAINTVFFAGLTLRNHSVAALDESLPVNRALAIIRKDLQNTVSPGGVLAGHFRVGGPVSSVAAGLASGGVTGGASRTTSGPASGSMGASVSGASAQALLDFFSSTAVLRDDFPSSDIQEVNYRLRPADNGQDAIGADLVRTVTRNLLAFSTPVPEEQVLLRDVETMEFEFYDGNDWRNTWDTGTSDTTLPMGVKLRLLQAVDPKRSVARREPIELLVMLNPAGTNSVTQSTEQEAAQ